MTRTYCEKEEAVLAALQSGTLGSELAEHLGQCESCREIVFVAKCLQRELGPAIAEARVPEAAFVWRRAQERARLQAIARAMRPIFLARLAAGIAAFLALVWAAFSAPAILAWMSELRMLPQLNLGATWPQVLTGSTLAGVVASLVCIGFSSWYMLRQD